MCGLWGFVADYALDRDVEVARLLATLSVLRGDDSSGAAVISSDEKKATFTPFVTKQLLNSAALMYDGRLRQELSNKMKHPSKVHVVMGHSRLATYGKIIKKNAHPFVHNEVIGAHNGTIDSFVKKHLVPGLVWDQHKQKCVQGQTWQPVDPEASDSRILFEKIYNDGLLKTATEVEDVNGAMAITWIDLRDETFNFYRNDKRPLYFMLSADKSTLFYASEEDFLSMVRKRIGFNNFDVIKTVPVNTHFKFPLGARAEKGSNTKLAPYKKYESAIIPFQPKEEPAKPKKKDFYETYQPYYLRNKSTTNVSSYASSLNPLNCGIWSGYHPDIVMQEEAAQHLLDKGCSWCNKKKKPWDDTYWFRPDEYVCEDCVEEPDVHILPGYDPEHLVQSQWDWVMGDGGTALN